MSLEEDFKNEKQKIHTVIADYESYVHDSISKSSVKKVLDEIENAPENYAEIYYIIIKELRRRLNLEGCEKIR